MVKICPVSAKRINENLSRLNAGFTVLVSTLFLITGLPVFAVILVIDFVFRNILEGRLNPVTRVNSYIIEVTGISRQLINAGPKIFAARIGLVLSTLGAFFVLYGNSTLALATIGILALFSFLESTFNFCVACKLYPYLLPLNQMFEQKQ